jgi:hypothetical protein
MVSQLLIYQRVRLCANLLWSDLDIRPALKLRASVFYLSFG